MRITSRERLIVTGFILLLAVLACGPASNIRTQPATVAAEPPAAAASEPPTPIQSPVISAEAAEVGLDQNNPAPFNGTVRSKNFEFSIVEVVRGDEAWSILKEVSPFNKLPDDENLEYVLVKVHIRSLETNDQTLYIDPALIDGIIGSTNVLYEKPSILDIKDPQPYFQAELAPGEEAEGWVTVLAAKGETGLVLVIQPRINGFSTGENDKRYISLEP